MSHRRVSARDKWSRKKWFSVYAPPAFGLKEVASIPAFDERQLINRTVEVTLYDLTGDLSQLHIKLKFQIKYVDGDKAFTQFKGFELARDYIRSIVRRGSTKIEGFFDVETKDGARLRVATLALTLKRCKTSQAKAIRKIMGEIVTTRASQLNFDEFIQEAVLGKIASEIFNKAKKIYPLRRAEVEKIKVLQPPPVDLAEIVKKTLAEAEAPSG
ncbi:MAG: 30S ribosomal protein S3ae [Thermoprotei archaeon]|nr:MAG: 30S ribosomal protein S3ae [Thermoprotei archaeon]RLF20906.1 MAG: 30S ribosomal protein S3ae [Thermoprotei archaeon]